MSELRRLGTAQLQRDRMLLPAEGQMTVYVAVDEGAGGDHLGVEPRARRHLAQEVAAVPVGPVHHRRDADAMGWCYIHPSPSLLLWIRRPPIPATPSGRGSKNLKRAKSSASFRPARVAASAMRCARWCR